LVLAQISNEAIPDRAYDFRMLGDSGTTMQRRGMIVTDNDLSREVVSAITGTAINDLPRRISLRRKGGLAGPTWTTCVLSAVRQLDTNHIRTKNHLCIRTEEQACSIEALASRLWNQIIADRDKA
jgi:hypothetical protein